jgi:flagellar basal-body rod protein FlgC
MGMFGILDISAAGMDVQQARLEAAAANLANAQTTGQGGAVYQPLTVIVHSILGKAVGSTDTLSAESLPRPAVSGTAQLDVPPRLVYDPGHPDADSRGFVSMPGVDPIASMLDLISISRSYEANLRAFDVTRTLMQRTLDMGNHR